MGCLALISGYLLCGFVPQRYRLAVESKVVSLLSSTVAKLTGGQRFGGKLSGAKSAAGSISASKSS